MRVIGSAALVAICAAVPLIVACGSSQGGEIAKASTASFSSAGPTLDIPNASGATLLDFARRIGVSCDQGDLHSCITGKIEVGDYLDVDLRPGCGTRSLYAVVAKQSAELRDRAAPLDRRTVAEVEAGQILCIEAIGRAGSMPAYYYVAAEPTVPPAACGTNSACPNGGAKKIRWIDPTIDDCAPRLRAAGQDRCAAGWIDAEAVVLIGR